MAQIGGVDKLSPAHLASAQTSYEAWDLKNKYSFENYVSYVQHQWKEKKPTPPWLRPPQPPKKPAYDPTAYAPKPADWKEQDLTAQFNAEQPPEPPPASKPAEDPEILRLRYVLFKLQQAEYLKFTEANAAAYRARETELTNATVWKMEDFEQRQREAREAFSRRQEPKRKGVRGLLAAIGDKLNPEAAEEKAAAKREDRALFRARQAKERRDFIAQLDADKKTQLEALRARQLQEQAAREKGYNEEIERRVRETRKAREIQREIEANDKARAESKWAEDFKKEQGNPWDDEPPKRENKRLSVHAATREPVPESCSGLAVPRPAPEGFALYHRAPAGALSVPAVTDRRAKQKGKARGPGPRRNSTSTRPARGRRRSRLDTHHPTPRD